MGSHVENSGRSSHHVNVLDAIRAVEDCALVVDDPGRGDMMGGCGGEWEDLVKFLYGSAQVLDSKGGVVTSPTGMSMQEDANPAVTSSSSGGKDEYGMGGWYAPLDDYDSIPFFPVEIRTNDQPVNQNSTTKRKRDDNDDDASDNNFASRKRMKNDPLQQQSDVKTTKEKVDVERKDRSIDFISDKNISENTQQPLPSYIPNFLPPFPPKHTYTKSAVPKPVPMDEFRSQNVRSSLIQLGRSYWGALPVAKVSQVERDVSSRGVFVKVKTEPLDVSAVAGDGMDVGAAGGGVEMKGVGVKPIVRASNTRFSKILEGSMDVH
jgi:hypothetical protein